jgi:hypothetical protein
MATSGEVVGASPPETARPARYEYHLGIMGLIHAVPLYSVTYVVSSPVSLL